MSAQSRVLFRCIPFVLSILVAGCTFAPVDGAPPDVPAAPVAGGSGVSSGAHVIQDTPVVFRRCTERGWVEAPHALMGRSYPTATTLADGTVLVAGGAVDASAERFLPGRREWVATGAMAVRRRFHAAVLLADGRVLATGGAYGEEGKSAELYDPSRNVWTPAAPMALSRRGHTASLLPDGRVLVTGGAADDLTSTELYDPRTNTWAAGPAMMIRRVFHSAVALADGSIMVVGAGANVTGMEPATAEWTRVAEVLRPDASEWTPSEMISERRSPFAAALPDGAVVVAGGSMKVAEALVGNTWVDAGAASFDRADTASVVTAEGNLLVVGGFTPDFDEGVAGSAEEFLMGGGWRFVAPLLVPRNYGHRLAVTGAGDVLLVGGGTSAAELYICGA